MPFEVFITDLSELMEEKARAREADMHAVLEGRSSIAAVHRKNAFLKNVREWTEIDMRQIRNHFDEEDDLRGGLCPLQGVSGSRHCAVILRQERTEAPNAAPLTSTPGTIAAQLGITGR